MRSVQLLSSSFLPVVTPDPSSYHPPTLWCRLLCHLLITIMIYLPSPAAPPHSCIIILRISLFDHFSAFPLKSDDIQWYPMHIRHNGASKTLIQIRVRVRVRVRRECPDGMLGHVRYSSKFLVPIRLWGV